MLIILHLFFLEYSVLLWFADTVLFYFKELSYYVFKNTLIFAGLSPIHLLDTAIHLLGHFVFHIHFFCIHYVFLEKLFNCVKNSDFSCCLFFPHQQYDLGWYTLAAISSCAEWEQ